MYQRMREAVESEALAGNLIQISAKVFNADYAVTQHQFMAGLPGAPAADGFQIAELLVISFFAIHFDVGKLIKFGIGFFTELLDILFGDSLAGSADAGSYGSCRCCP